MNKFLDFLLDSSLRWNDIIYGCHSRENGNPEKLKEFIDSYLYCKEYVKMQLAFKNYATLVVACWLNKDYFDGILSFIANVKPDQAEMTDFLKDISVSLSPELNEPYNELLNLAINDIDFSELADAFLKEFCNV